MCWGQVAQYGIPAVLALVGMDQQKKAGEKGGKALDKASQAQLDFLGQQQDLALKLSAPFRQSSSAAQAAMMDMMGLPRGSVPDSVTGGTTGIVDDWKPTLKKADEKRWLKENYGDLGSMVKFGADPFGHLGISKHSSPKSKV